MKPIFLRKSRPNRPAPPAGTPLLLSAPGQTSDTPEQAAIRQEAPAIPADPTALYARIRDEAIAYGEELTAALTADLREGELSRLEELWQKVPFFTGVVNTARVAIRQATIPPPCSTCEGLIPSLPGYAISSRFLTCCHNFLTADPRGFERLHLVTGIKLGDTPECYTLDDMTRVAMSDQSAIGAKADQNSLRQALIELDTFGHALTGLFHSHPGRGAQATHPSTIDLTTHKRFEQGGYPLIGAIFVPGFVRFFSAERPFTLTVYGKGVTPVPGEHHVYQIQRPSIPRGVSDEAIARS